MRFGNRWVWDMDMPFVGVADVLDYADPGHGAREEVSFRAARVTG